MEFLNTLANWANQAWQFLSSSSVEIAVGSVGIFLLDAAMRIWKTEKPRDVLRMIASLAHAMAKLLEQLAVMLDKLVPQRLKETVKVEDKK